MYIIPQEIANIMATYPIRAEQLRKLYEMKDDEMAMEYQNDLMDVLEERGWSERAAMVAVIYSPLLLENRAISQMIEDRGYYHLRPLMPEVLTIDEMMILAEGDYMLTIDESNQVRQITQNLLNRTSKNAPE